MSDIASILHEVVKTDWTDFRDEGDTAYDGQFVVVEVIEGDEGRWSRFMSVITRHIPTDTYYQWEYQSGLTEYQEDELWDDKPVQVEPSTKTITVTEWKPVKP
jgi:hypothetical protein